MGRKVIVELTPKQQTLELIKSSQDILVTCHKSPDGDAIGSSLALGSALKALGKNITIVCSDEVSRQLSFVPDVETIQQTLTGSKDFIISIDTTKSANGELKLGYKHDKDSRKLTIIITPTKGSIQNSDVEFSASKPKFDLIIALDTPDIERLGSFYDQFPELFYETPVINIDHHASNNHYAKINWVDITATSTCEIMVSLLESLSSQNNNLKLLDENIATKLLTGIITDTGSFQNANTTPKSFTVAAQLVGAGARQQEIIKNIFKTKTLSTLHLWGRVLTNVVEEKDPRFIWSYVSNDDIRTLNASPDELSGVIDELLKSAPDMDFALLLSEKPASNETDMIIKGSFRAINPAVDVINLANIFGGGGHPQAAAFEQPRSGPLATQIEQIIGKIKSRSIATRRLEMPTV